ncbi:ribonuclease E/G, partial [Hungatella effluvii]
LSDLEWKKRIKPILEAEKEEDFGIIVRTNAPEASFDAILEELKSLKALYRRVMEDALHRTCYSLLYRTPPSYLTDIRDSFHGSLGAIVTDETDIYEAIQAYLKSFQPGDLQKLTFYDDALLPLSKLYKVEKSMSEALGKRVWLKSGGYLVIEPTEALCVIDVNTGKYSGKKNLHDTIMKINTEAAVEIARQLRLRNLSGIIIIDFIDMETEEDQRELLSVLSRVLAKDPVKTSVVEITKLNLVEVTRKKIRRPFHEQAALIKGKADT